MYITLLFYNTYVNLALDFKIKKNYASKAQFLKLTKLHVNICSMWQIPVLIRVHVSHTIPRLPVLPTVLRVPELADIRGTGPDSYAQVSGPRTGTQIPGYSEL